MTDSASSSGSAPPKAIAPSDPPESLPASTESLPAAADSMPTGSGSLLAPSISLPAASSQGGAHGGPPDSFARLFLEGVSKYRKQIGHNVGSPMEEAASNLAQRTAPARAAHGLDLRSPRAIAETVAITVGLPALGYLIDRTDPFFIQYRFSWIIFAPLLIALRHGFMLGFASAAMLDLALVVGWRTHLLAIDRFPGEAFVGLIAVSIVVGQFSDVWKREILRLDAGFGALRKQNNELTRSHFLLELSHDRLGEQVGRNANSLREAIVAVRELAQDAKVPPSYESLGSAMLEVLGAYCMLEVGELYVVERAALGKPVAILGRPIPTEARHPLVAKALSSGQLTYVPTASLPDHDRELTKSPLLAAVPFVDTTGRVNAVLCVQAMPFISFEKRNLEAMVTLAGHFADLVAYRGKPTDVDRGRREIFEVGVNRALRDLQERKVPSVVAFLWIRRGAAMADLIDTMLGGALRELEFPYVVRDPSGNSFIYVLLPTADDEAARSLGTRFEAVARKTRNKSLRRLGVSFSYHVLQPTDSVLGIFRLFSQKAQQNEVRYESRHLPQR